MIYSTWNTTKISKFILGGNPFSGFSHQSSEKDWEMRRFFTSHKIKETLFDAEKLGINSIVARTDHHMLRILYEFYQEGGKLQLFAQTCPEYLTPSHSIERAEAYGATGCQIHGGVMDYLLAQKRLDEVKPIIEMIHKKNMLAGIAGHNPDVFIWAEESRLPVDYFMCSYYNPTKRDENAEHQHNAKELFLVSDRDKMIDTINQLSKPVIHYKILAAGRTLPNHAFSYTAKHLRQDDAVCVGIYQKDKPDMLAENVGLLGSFLKT